MIVFMLCSLIPQEHVVEECCAAIELNTVYSRTGGETLTQWILWDSYEDTGVVCRGWKMLAGERLTRSGGKWAMVWNRGGVLHRVSAPLFLRTHTQRDPEVDDRELFPVNHRRFIWNRWK